MFRIILLCTLFVIVRSQVTSVNQCIVTPAELPIHQYVQGCTTPPCLLPQGENVVIDVVFRAPHTIRRMRTLAKALITIFGATTEIDYPLGNNEITCNFLTNTYCPVLPGEVVQYTLRMFIETFFPPNFPVVVEFRVEDDNSDTIWCIRVPISVVATSTNNRITAANN
ncbi:NPC intracellular cholesterol transporter 2-like [Melitaea cinxia]|uniref:NPC intracellular cholesterol transporter 2-like n=1 Tax=Melitaea cinxia TaxID=113334 RepID=UPI001E26EB7A|nr:NPC intracellular cholesterol transporter 2-like [Melitaea cinxia]